MGTESSQSPPVTAELGSLNARPNEGSRFIGSSSGVYFVKTVRNAFSAASNAAQNESQASPLDEEIVVGSDVESDDGSTAGSEHDDSIQEPLQRFYDIQSICSAIGYPPERHIATELAMTYFRTWHKLLPFLHGPSFLRELELLYASDTPRYNMKNVTQAIVSQCVFNIASLDRPDLEMPLQCKIRSSKAILFLLGLLGQKHDIITVQALLACQIYLLATMALRAASTVGGLIIRAALHSGLHRCPSRYEQLSQHECDIRKRVFWTVYSVDRYLTQALGQPLGIQDSDVDVCYPGERERHRTVPNDRRLSKDPTAELFLHLPKQEKDHGVSQQLTQPFNSSDPSGRESETKMRREAALAHYGKYSKIIGRVVEVFHKSIHSRHADRNTILVLNSDIDSWWNELPSHLQDLSPGVKPEATDLSAFFNILYHQVTLQFNRPSLSLDPASPEFRNGLQICIKAGRAIISLLRENSATSQTKFWPGFMSAVWMSGLVIAFACQLGWYNKEKGTLEIRACLAILDTMAERWHTAKSCRVALASLLRDITTKKPDPPSIQSRRHPSMDEQEQPTDISWNPSPKRRKMNGINELEPDRKPTSLMRHPSLTIVPGQQYYPSSALSVTSDSSSNAMEKNLVQPSPLEGLNIPDMTPRPEPVYMDQTHLERAPVDFSTPNYAAHNQTMIPRDPALTWSNMVVDSTNGGIPQQYYDDRYLSGIDFNVLDVFEGATWENLMSSMNQDGG